MKKIDECDGCATGTVNQDQNSISISTSYNSEIGEKSISVTAKNEKADELAQILALSGLLPQSEPRAEIAPVPEPATGLSVVPQHSAVVVGESFSELPPELDDQDAEKNSMYCDRCGGYHDGECPPDIDQDACAHCHEYEADGESAFCARCNEIGYGDDGISADREMMDREDFAMNDREPDDFETYNQNEADDYRDEFNEGYIYDEHTKTCGNCGFPREVGIHSRADAEELCADCYKYQHDSPEIFGEESMCAACHENPAEQDGFCHNCLENDNEFFESVEDETHCKSCKEPVSDKDDTAFYFKEGYGPYCEDCYDKQKRRDDIETGNFTESIGDNDEDDYPKTFICRKCKKEFPNEDRGRNGCCDWCSDSVYEAIGDNDEDDEMACEHCGDNHEDGECTVAPDDFETYNHNKSKRFDESNFNESHGYYLKLELGAFDNYKTVYIKQTEDGFAEAERKYATVFDMETAKNIGAKLKLNGAGVKRAYVVPVLAVEESTMNESLSPERTKTGVNDASKSWVNEPNEQMAGWRALVQDSDGLSQPHDMFNPVKGSDNIMTVATRKKETEKPSGNFGANAVTISKIAEQLQKKFDSLKEDFCVSCDKKIPSGSDIDQCKTCYKKDHPKKGKKKVTESDFSRSGTCARCGGAITHNEQAGWKHVGKPKVGEKSHVPYPEKESMNYKEKNRVAESLSKSQTNKLQGMLDNLEKRVKKLGAPPSAKTKITQSMGRFKEKIAAMKDALSKRKGEDKDEDSKEDKPESKKGNNPFSKGSEKESKSSDKSNDSYKPKSSTKEAGKEAEPKPKGQKETASDKPDTNGDDSAPAGKIKDMGKGIYEGNKIKGAIRRELSKDIPVLQSRRDQATGKAAEAFNNGDQRKGERYLAWVDKNRKADNVPPLSADGKYKTKLSDYTNESTEVEKMQNFRNIITEGTK